MLRLRQLEDGGGQEGGERLEAGLGEVVGCKQRDLLEWYFKYLVEK